MKHMYIDRNYGDADNKKYRVIGNGAQRIFRGDKQPFIQRNNDVEIKRNEPFYIAGAPDRKANSFQIGSILENCTFLGTTTLTAHDRTEINKLYPNFCFNYLSRWESQSRKTRSTNWGSDDLIFFHQQK